MGQHSGCPLHSTRVQRQCRETSEMRTNVFCKNAVRLFFLHRATCTRGRKNATYARAFPDLFAYRCMQVALKSSEDGSAARLHAGMPMAGVGSALRAADCDGLQTRSALMPPLQQRLPLECWHNIHQDTMRGSGRRVAAPSSRAPGAVIARPHEVTTSEQQTPPMFAGTERPRPSGTQRLATAAEETYPAYTAEV